MSIQFEHPLYSKYIGKWTRCRDAASGQDAVHAGNATYLPKLKDQTDEDYQAYKKRASFFNATWRTVSGLSGMLFRKPPQIDVAASVQPMLNAVTEDGLPIGIFAREVVEECLIAGRIGVLVDYPTVNTEGLTKADADRLNLRPTLAAYRAETIINWKLSVIANQRVLVMVVLKEEAEVAVDEFESSIEDRYRVLDLVDGKEGGKVYRVRLFKTDSQTKAEVQIGNDLFPSMATGTLDFIPFYFISTDDTAAEPDDPPLIDLVDLNLSHYRVTADYEHGCHFTGLPTGYIAGYTKAENEKIYLGSQTMMIFPDPNVTVGFLEFSGAGLGSLRENLERKELQLAILGARMLESQKRAAESAEAAGLHRAGENSILADAAQAISLGMTAVMKTFSLWAGADGAATFMLNRDFFPMPMSPQDIAALVSSWQQGAISKQTLFDNLQRGQVIADNIDFETEEVRINDQLLLSSGSGTGTIEGEGDHAAGTGTGEGNANQTLYNDALLQATLGNQEAISGLAASIAALPAPVVNVAAPEHTSPPAVPGITPEQTAHNAAMLQASQAQLASLAALAEAVRNTPAPIVNVAAPVINLPEQPAPIVNVAAPIVNVAAPETKEPAQMQPIVLQTGTGHPAGQG